MTLKFNTSVAKGLKVKLKMFWGLSPTFVEVTGGKLLRGSFLVPPILNIKISVTIFCPCRYFFVITLLILRLYSTGASDRSFSPIFNKRFDHFETLLTICSLSARSLCGSLVPSPRFKCPKRTFVLPQKYHISVSNMLPKQLKCFTENEN